MRCGYLAFSFPALRLVLAVSIFEKNFWMSGWTVWLYRLNRPLKCFLSEDLCGHGTLCLLNQECSLTMRFHNRAAPFLANISDIRMPAVVRPSLNHGALAVNVGNALFGVMPFLEGFGNPMQLLFNFGFGYTIIYADQGFVW